MRLDGAWVRLPTAYASFWEMKRLRVCTNRNQVVCVCSAGDKEMILFTFPQPMEMSEYGQSSARSGDPLGVCIV